MRVIKSLKDENEFLRQEVDDLRSELTRIRRRMDRLKIFFWAYREQFGFEDEPEPKTYEELLRWYEKIQRFLAHNSRGIGW